MVLKNHQFIYILFFCFYYLFRVLLLFVYFGFAYRALYSRLSLECINEVARTLFCLYTQKRMASIFSDCK